MTRIALEEQELADADWFAIDSAGQVGHFASWCRQFPESVASSREALNEITGCIESLPPNRSKVTVEQCVRSYVDEDEIRTWDEYLHDFLKTAEKGLYSFDTSMRDPKGPFFRVAIPNAPLHYSELPETISCKLQRTCYSGEFADSVVVHQSQIE